MTRSDDRSMARFIARVRESACVPAIILDSSVNGLSYVRSLSRKGVPVICADSRKGIASRSRFGSFVSLPVEAGDDIAGEQSATRMIQRFNDAGIEPVVLGAADAWQVYLARLVAEAPGRVHTLLPTAAIMEQIVDKQAQYEAAACLGIRVAPFANAALVLSGAISWEAFPAIIKPRWSHTGRTAIGGKAARVQDYPALMAALSALEQNADASAYLVQAVIPGPDNCLYAYLGCYDSDGQEAAWLIKRKLRQCPPGFGDGSFDVTCVNQPVAEEARRLLLGINYRGLAGVEFKQNPDTSELTLIEINPRTVSTNQLAIRAGVNFPWIAYRLALGECGARDNPAQNSLEPKYFVDVYHVNEEREFRSFLLRRQTGEVNLVSWLREILSAQSYAFWDRADPYPFVWSLLAGVRRRLVRKNHPVAVSSSPP